MRFALTVLSVVAAHSVKVARNIMANIIRLGAGNVVIAPIRVPVIIPSFRVSCAVIPRKPMKFWDFSPQREEPLALANVDITPTTSHPCATTAWS